MIYEFDTFVRKKIELNLEKIHLKFKSPSQDQNEIGRLILITNRLYKLLNKPDPEIKERIDDFYSLYEMNYLPY